MSAFETDGIWDISYAALLSMFTSSRPTEQSTSAFERRYYKRPHATHQVITLRLADSLSFSSDLVTDLRSDEFTGGSLSF